MYVGCTLGSCCLNLVVKIFEIVCFSNDALSCSVSRLHLSNGCDLTTISKSVFSRVWNEVSCTLFFYKVHFASVVASLPVTSLLILA